VEDCIRIYCNQKLNDPSGALKALVVSVLAIVPPISQRELPSWIQNLLEFASISSQNTIQAACMHSSVECLVKSQLYWINDTTLMQWLNWSSLRVESKSEQRSTLKQLNI
jgi:hypothetical protein